MSKEKMIAVAKRGLALEENFKLDMSNFCSVYYKSAKPECGTAFCFVGILAYQDGYPEVYYCGDKFDYADYSIDLIGCHEFRKEWDFLFGGCWPNSFEHLKSRCQYVVDHNGSVPYYYDDGSFEGFPHE